VRKKAENPKENNKRPEEAHTSCYSSVVLFPPAVCCVFVVLLFVMLVGDAVPVATKLVRFFPFSLRMYVMSCCVVSSVVWLLHPQKKLGGSQDTKVTLLSSQPRKTRRPAGAVGEDTSPHHCSFFRLKKYKKLTRLPREHNSAVDSLRRFFCQFWIHLVFDRKEKAILAVSNWIFLYGFVHKLVFCSKL
jgi:hypothetical protein